MTNHYTSYSVSKQLHDAGIALHKYPPAVFILPDGTIAPSDAEWEDGYPAYQAGELLRELPCGYSLAKAINIDTGVEFYFVHKSNNIYDRSKHAPNPEDAPALALIELRKEKEDDN